MIREFLLTIAMISTLWSISSPLCAQIITTVAGSTGIGDGGAATLATVNPTGVAVDANGNVYIAEQENNRIRKVSPGGIITTVAGTGIAGLSGDGGSAILAKLNYPRSVAVDAAGNLYISDVNNHRIRRVSTAGIITTVAGSNFGGFAGDGGAATSATLFYPNGIALDAAGNLYIVDTNNHRVRKVNTSGIISTVAGTGVQGFSGDGGPATSAQFSLPIGIAVGPDGSLFVTIPENNNCRVRRITLNGIITTFAGTATCNDAGDGGAATSASLNSPLGVAVDGAGNVFIADANNSRIRRVGTNGIISTVAGFTNGYGYEGDGGPATAARLASPLAVAVDGSGKIYIADRDNGRIRVVSSSGIISTLAGPNNEGFGGDGGPATSARMNYPTDVKADKNGNYFIADHGNDRVRKVDADGIISTVAGLGSSGFAGDGGLATQAQLNGVHSILPDGNGNLLIADAFNNRIRKVNAAGIITTIVGSPNYGFAGDGGPATSAHLRTPYALALDNFGLLYITDSNNNRIRRIDSNGIITTVVGTGTPGFSGDGGPATSAQIDFPTGIAFDAANNLYIADNRNHRIRRVSPAGIISTVAGDGSRGFSGDNGLATAAQLLFPWKVTVAASGVVFFSDNGNTRVRRIGTDGVISTLVGTYGRGFSGDGGPAQMAQLNGPFGLGLDGAGNMLIADAYNARIRKVSCIAPPVVSIVASSTTVCVGDEVILTASSTDPNVSYSWSGTTPIASTSLGSALAYPTRGNNTYTVAVTSVGGCSVNITISIQAIGFQSIDNGNWNDPSIWSCGRIPASGDSVEVKHIVTVPDNFIAQANIISYSLAGSLRFEVGSSLKLGNTQIELFASAKMVSDNSNKALENIDDSKLVFKPDNDISEFKVGDILVSGIHENAPNGYLRKIVSIDKSGAQTTFNTENVALNELIKNGDIKTVFDLSSEAVRQNVATPKTNVISSTKLSAGIILFDADGNTGTTEDQLRLTGNFDNKLTGYINWKFTDNGTSKSTLSYFISKYDIVNETYLKVDLPSIEIPVIEKILDEYQLPPIRIPAIPFLPIRPAVSLKAGINFTGSVSVPIQMFAKITTKGIVGVEYKNGQTSGINSWDSLLDSPITGFREESASATFELLVYLKPEIKFNLFDQNYSYVEKIFKANANAAVGYQFDLAKIKATVTKGNNITYCYSANANAYASLLLSLLNTQLADANITGLSVPLLKGKCTESKNPIVTILGVSDVTINSAKVDAKIKNFKSANVTHYGICYSKTNTNPTVADERREVPVEGVLLDEKQYSTVIYALVPSSIYFVKAFARTDSGVFYSDTLSFKTLAKPVVYLAAVNEGNNQTAGPDKELAYPLKVKITFEDGQPAPGATVKWLVKSGGGRTVADTSLTDNIGIAEMKWTLGNGGNQQLEAYVNKETGSKTASFSAQFQQSDTYLIGIVSGNNQEGKSNGALSNPLVVKVSDINGVAVSNVKVGWTVRSGNGQLSTGESTTNQQGLAVNSWTLGSSGRQEVEVLIKKANGGWIAPINFSSTFESVLPLLKGLWRLDTYKHIDYQGIEYTQSYADVQVYFLFSDNGDFTNGKIGINPNGKYYVTSNNVRIVTGSLGSSPDGYRYLVTFPEDGKLLLSGPNQGVTQQFYLHRE